MGSVKKSSHLFDKVSVCCFQKHFNDFEFLSLNIHSVAFNLAAAKTKDKILAWVLLGGAYWIGNGLLD